METRNDKKVLYKCNNCNYSTNRKSNFLSHINRRSPCVKENLDDASLEFSDSTLSKDGKIFKCDKCNKEFSTKWNLKRHLGSCNNIDNGTLKCEICQIEFTSVRSKNKHKRTVACIPIHLQNNINNNVNNITNHNTTTNNNNNHNNTLNITNNNIQNNIVVNAFGKENYDYLLDENHRLKKIIENKDAFMQKMITLVHFDKEHPENHNIMMTNMQSKHVHVYDGQKFVKALKEQTFDKLITDKRDFIVSNVDDLGLTKECELELKEKLITIKLNQEKRKLLKDKVELICYNNKELIISS